MRSALLTLPYLLALASCTSPPKPPLADESKRRPVNATSAVELQVCKGQLHNTRIEVAESSRHAEAAKATVSQIAALQRATAASPARVDSQRNTLYSVLFAFGSTQVDAQALENLGVATEARTAPLIMVSGRTDGTTETPAESRVARERAEAVRRYLIGAGVNPASIRTTWQPVGDHAADNSAAGGRRLNRRVEIEIYRAAPVAATMQASDQS
jgi:outer membrane protein OmpA-like peptidoglycan-associated protein